jgi:hypothetical protein
MGLFMIVPFILKDLNLAIIALFIHLIYFKYYYSKFREKHQTDDSYNQYTQKIDEIKKTKS